MSVRSTSPKRTQMGDKQNPSGWPWARHGRDLPQKSPPSTSETSAFADKSIDSKHAYPSILAGRADSKPPASNTRSTTPTLPESKVDNLSEAFPSPISDPVQEDDLPHADSPRNLDHSRGSSSSRETIVEDRPSTPSSPKMFQWEAAKKPQVYEPIATYRSERTSVAEAARKFDQTSNPNTGRYPAAEKGYHSALPGVPSTLAQIMALPRAGKEPQSSSYNPFSNEADIPALQGLEEPRHDEAHSSGPNMDSTYDNGHHPISEPRAFLHDGEEAVRKPELSSSAPISYETNDSAGQNFPSNLSAHELQREASPQSSHGLVHRETSGSSQPNPTASSNHDGEHESGSKQPPSESLLEPMLAAPEKTMDEPQTPGMHVPGSYGLEPQTPGLDVPGSYDLEPPITKPDHHNSNRPDIMGVSGLKQPPAEAPPASMLIDAEKPMDEPEIPESHVPGPHITKSGHHDFNRSDSMAVSGLKQPSAEDPPASMLVDAEKPMDEPEIPESHVPGPHITEPEQHDPNLAKNVAAAVDSEPGQRDATPVKKQRSFFRRLSRSEGYKSHAEKKEEQKKEIREQAALQGHSSRRNSLFPEPEPAPEVPKTKGLAAEEASKDPDSHYNDGSLYDFESNEYSLDPPSAGPSYTLPPQTSAAAPHNPSVGDNIANRTGSTNEKLEEHTDTTPELPPRNRRHSSTDSSSGVPSLPPKAATYQAPRNSGAPKIFIIRASESHESHESLGPNSKIPTNMKDHKPHESLGPNSKAPTNMTDHEPHESLGPDSKTLASQTHHKPVVTTLPPQAEARDPKRKSRPTPSILTQASSRTGLLASELGELEVPVQGMISKPTKILRKSRCAVLRGPILQMMLGRELARKAQPLLKLMAHGVEVDVDEEGNVQLKETPPKETPKSQKDTPTEETPKFRKVDREAEADARIREGYRDDNAEPVAGTDGIVEERVPTSVELWRRQYARKKPFTEMTVLH